LFGVIQQCRRKRVTKRKTALEPIFNSQRKHRTGDYKASRFDEVLLPRGFKYDKRRFCF
jgi:hypothetical protein